MLLDDDRHLAKIVLYEKVLEGVASSVLPFMIKGSFLHCRCFPRPQERLRLSDGPDFVALTPYWGSVIDTTGDGLNRIAAETGIDEVLRLVAGVLERQWTASGGSGGVCGMPPVAISKEIFAEDDFSTLRATVAHAGESYMLDFAVNLCLYEQPVSSLYEPVRGIPFTLPYAASMEVQVAWKLHQCLIRTRAKDLVDLIYMLGDIELADEKCLYAVLKTALGECHESAQSDILVGRLRSLLALDTGFIHDQMTKSKDLAYFRRHAENFRSFLMDLDEDIVDNLFFQFEMALRDSLKHARWNEVMGEIIENRDYMSIAIEL
jgi:hypothetical protein